MKGGVGWREDNMYYYNYLRTKARAVVSNSDDTVLELTASTIKRP